MAEIRIEETKRGAPWMIIILLLIVAAVIGWWLWSNRASGTPSGAVADSTAVVTDSSGRLPDTAARTP